MADEMNLWNRLQGETPKFFKRVIAVSISLAAAGGALLTAPMIIKGFVLPAKIELLAQWFCVGGLVSAAISKTTITGGNPPTFTAPKDEEQQNSGK